MSWRISVVTLGALALSGLPLSGALAAGPGAGSSAPSAMGDEPSPSAMGDEIIESAFVTFTVRDGETEVTHPGFDAYHGEDTILELTIGDTSYEFKIFVDRKDDKAPYDVEVSLSRNGKILVGSSKQKVPPKKQVEISAGSVSVSFLVDPHGALDKSRKKKIKGPDGDAPMD